MIVDNNHEINIFKQSKWLQKYIKFNTQKILATNDFEKELFI